MSPSSPVVSGLPGRSFVLKAGTFVIVISTAVFFCIFCRLSFFIYFFIGQGGIMFYYLCTLIRIRSHLEVKIPKLRTPGCRFQLLGYQNTPPTPIYHHQNHQKSKFDQSYYVRKTRRHGLTINLLYILTLTCLLFTA